MFPRRLYTYCEHSYSPTWSQARERLRSICSLVSTFQYRSSGIEIAR